MSSIGSSSSEMGRMVLGLLQLNPNTAEGTTVIIFFPLFLIIPAGLASSPSSPALDVLETQRHRERGGVVMPPSWMGALRVLLGFTGCHWAYWTATSC